MINNEIKLKAEVFNKKQIALTNGNAYYENEIDCSLLDHSILVSCNICSLKKMCEGIDNVSQEIKKRTGTTVNQFKFN